LFSAQVYGGIREIFPLFANQPPHNTPTPANIISTPPLRLLHEAECLPVATVNLQRIIYLGSALLVELPLSVAFWESTLVTTAVSNDSGTTSVRTTFLTSTHPIKSSSSDRTRASTSVPPFLVSSRWITSLSRSRSLGPPSRMTASSVPASILLAPTAFRPTTRSLLSTS
jgi:hypothetical protein